MPTSASCWPEAEVGIDVTIVKTSPIGTDPASHAEPSIR